MVTNRPLRAKARNLRFARVASLPKIGEELPSINRYS